MNLKGLATPFTFLVGAFVVLSVISYLDTNNLWCLAAMNWAIIAWMCDKG